MKNRLMLKVLRGIRILNSKRNKREREEKYNNFCATSHHEVAVLGKVFQKWREVAAEQKKVRVKEKEDMLSVKEYMELVIKRIYFKKLVKIRNERKQGKENYLLAMRF
mmetsp:Transcript_13611/g.13541  ORF Transcript_13611/g.13541 Transcript_13611/m.13541 type:complete len:108 (+) Transcript_13611:399-722(+)